MIPNEEEIKRAVNALLTMYRHVAEDDGWYSIQAEAFIDQLYGKGFAESQIDLLEKFSGWEEDV